MRLRFATALLALAAAAAAVLVSIFLVHDALADGDPASDYLIAGQLFLPFTANVTSSQAVRLRGLLDDSKAKGFPLKVAVIAARSDLGAVPSLFGKPQHYASFLGQEDYYFFKDELLVVMPQGYGLYKHDGLPAGDRVAVAALPPPGGASVGMLTAAAERAVTALASRHGLTLSAGGTSRSSRWHDRLVILAGLLVLLVFGLSVRLFLRSR